MFTDVDVQVMHAVADELWSVALWYYSCGSDPVKGVSVHNQSVLNVLMRSCPGLPANLIPTSGLCGIGAWSLLEPKSVWRAIRHSILAEVEGKT